MKAPLVPLDDYYYYFPRTDMEKRGKKNQYEQMRVSTGSLEIKKPSTTR